MLAADPLRINSTPFESCNKSDDSRARVWPWEIVHNDPIPPRPPYPSVHTRWATIHPSHDILRLDSRSRTLKTLHSDQDQHSNSIRKPYKNSSASPNIHLLHIYTYDRSQPPRGHTYYESESLISRRNLFTSLASPLLTPTHQKMYSCVNQPRGCRGRVNTPGGRCDSCRVSYLSHSRLLWQSCG